MVNGKNARGAKFRLLKQGEVFLTVRAGGDIWKTNKVGSLRVLSCRGSPFVRTNSTSGNSATV